MDTLRKGLAAHRLTILTVMAVSGWGAFAYSALTGASSDRQAQVQAVAGTNADRTETAAAPVQQAEEDAAQKTASNAAEPAAAAVTGSVKAMAPETASAEQAAAPTLPAMPASVKVAEASLQPPTAEPAASVSPEPKRININTATAEELNALGRYGTAIMSRRPYKKVEDLLSKKVLTRSAFSKIKDQITVN